MLCSCAVRKHKMIQRRLDINWLYSKAFFHTTALEVSLWNNCASTLHSFNWKSLVTKYAFRTLSDLVLYPSQTGEKLLRYTRTEIGRKCDTPAIVCLASKRAHEFYSRAHCWFVLCTVVQRRVHVKNYKVKINHTNAKWNSSVMQNGTNSSVWQKYRIDPDFGFLMKNPPTTLPHKYDVWNDIAGL